MLSYSSESYDSSSISYNSFSTSISKDFYAFNNLLLLVNVVNWIYFIELIYVLFLIGDYFEILVLSSLGLTDTLESITVFFFLISLNSISYKTLYWFA